MPSDFTTSNKEKVASTSPTPVPPRKKLSRRKVLALVSGGAVWRAADQGVFSTGQGPAYELWDDWRTAKKGPLDLVRAAILAANPHNSQPWLFHVTHMPLSPHSMDNDPCYQQAVADGQYSHPC